MRIWIEKLQLFNFSTIFKVTKRKTIALPCSRCFGHVPSITEDFVRDQILTDGNRQKLMKKLSRVRSNMQVSSDGRSAGVLLPLCIADGQLSILYTLRSSALSTHAGQVR